MTCFAHQMTWHEPKLIQHKQDTRYPDCFLAGIADIRALEKLQIYSGWPEPVFVSSACKPLPPASGDVGFILSCYCQNQASVHTPVSYNAGSVCLASVSWPLCWHCYCVSGIGFLETEMTTHTRSHRGIALNLWCICFCYNIPEAGLHHQGVCFDG